MKMHYKRIIVSLISLISALSLTGCSSMMSSHMPQGSISMQQAYNDAINGSSGTGGGTLKQVRTRVSGLRTSMLNYSTYTRTQKNDINLQFPQLPNPSIVMYVYPHEAGSGYNLMPVPGYSTVFPMYRYVYYAIPGET